VSNYCVRKSSSNPYCSLFPVKSSLISTVNNLPQHLERAGFEQTLSSNSETKVPKPAPTNHDRLAQCDRATPHSHPQSVIQPISFRIMDGSLAVKVDAHYTSQACPHCGHTSKENRPNKGLTFVCQQCGYTLHADLVGARNVALRVLLSHSWRESMGRISAVPDVSGDETKTDYRLRYSGLRWSQDAIPNFNEVTPQGGTE